MTDVFPIVPAAARTLWILIGVLALVFAGILGLVVASAQGATKARFELSADGLRIRGDLYGRLIPASSLQGGAARVVNLRTERELAPRIRTMGTAVPGYGAGWFRLRNGRKGLLYLTDRTRAVHVPTSEGFDLLLSPQEPDRFVARLRAIAPGS